VKARFLLNVRWILAAALLPLMLLGLYVLAMQVYEGFRYDPSYFAAEYAAKYDTPGAVAKSLETALQIGDRALMSELEGRQAAALKAMPSLVFIMLWDRTDRYYTYLYVNRDTYERHTYHVEQVQGRYVVTPADAYYYLHAGRWMGVFVPAAITWWVLELFAVLLVWIYRLSTHLREQMYGG
jgi:hypothetical protein